MTTALISCCNEALSLIGASDIAALDEGSIESRECNRFATSLLQEIGAWFEWPLRIKRVALASLTNDRPAEWLYAYAVPTDMEKPIAIRSVEDDATDLPEYGPYSLPVQDSYPVLFRVEGGKVYTNVETATLVYTGGAIEASDLSPLLRWAFITELAARIALPVKKDAKIAQAMKQQAMMAKGDAIAAEMDKNPRRETRYVSEVEYARAGIGV